MTSPSQPPPQRVRGTEDLYFDASALYRRIENESFQLARTYGFEEIKTPIFENSEIFHRSLGDSSDIVSKETYTFIDRGGDSITLRPEGTAGIARAFISNGLTQHLPLKFYYSGPMFRYERPQKGRNRQFHQIGIEMLGFDSYLADLEGIALAQHLLKNLGVMKNTTLLINSLGDHESRLLHRKKFVDYLTPFKAELSHDSQKRFEKNPLRILDSKEPQDQKLVQDSPKLKDYLNDASNLYFQQTQAGLQALGIPFQVEDRLVRGIDYYTHTVFEFVSTDLGAQSTLLAGGRYDGLVQQLGGPSTSGFGWAAGLERLILVVQAQTSATTKQDTPELIALIPLSENLNLTGLVWAQRFRNQNKAAEVILTGNLSKKMKKAAKQNARWAVIFGDQEIQKKVFSVKDLRTGQQTECVEADLLNFIK